MLDIQRLLGFMASMVLMVPHARLHMRTFQNWFICRFNISQHHASTFLSLAQFWNQILPPRVGIPSGVPKQDLTLTTDAPLSDWSTHSCLHSISWDWAPSEQCLHINKLELQAVHYALNDLSDTVSGLMVLVPTDNTTTMYYINKQGDRVFLALSHEAILLWNYMQCT